MWQRPPRMLSRGVQQAQGRLFAGMRVSPGQALLVLSAMKMETSIGAPCAGIVQHVAVDKGDAIDAGKRSACVLSSAAQSCMHAWHLRLDVQNLWQSGYMVPCGVQWT